MELKQFRFLNSKFKVYLRNQADKSVLAEIFQDQEYRCAENIIKLAQFPIIDAGAQAGFFILYCRALNAKIKIYALEPETENAQILAKHLKINHLSGVKIYQQALAEKSSQRKFYVSADSHDHSLIKPDHYKEEVAAFCISLAEFLTQHKLDRVSLLKMDIEGAEYEVFGSLLPKDWLKLENILMEYHDLPNLKHAQLAELIRQQGFSLEIFPSHYDKRFGFILARNKKLISKG